MPPFLPFKYFLFCSSKFSLEHDYTFQKKRKNKVEAGENWAGAAGTLEFQLPVQLCLARAVR